MQSAPEHEVSPEAVNTIAKHAFRQEVAKGIAGRIENIADRVTAWRAVMDLHPDQSSDNSTKPGVQNRPELRVMGKWAPPDYSSPDHRSAFDISRDQAQSLIDSAAPVDMNRWREQARLGRISPGPGIPAASENDRTIRWESHFRDRGLGKVLLFIFVPSGGFAIPLLKS
jgi:hypothetical protein